MFTLPVYNPPDFGSAPLKDAPDARTAPCEAPGVAPEGFHSTSVYPEYFKIGGVWTIIRGSRMDCAVVLREGGRPEAVEVRRLEPGDAVFVGRQDDGSEGIVLHPDGFSANGAGGSMDGEEQDSFAFRSGRSRETSFAGDYENLAELLRHDRSGGHIVWVLGPAAVFDRGSREAMAYIVEQGYCHAFFGGNAVATHDLEGAMFGTALGQSLETCQNAHGGHYHHLDLLNRATRAGSVEALIDEYGLSGGVICACVKKGVPLVLAGSIRDDGPLPDVYTSTKEAQDAMREHTGRATTVICLGTQLHSIATGNMTPSYTVTEDGTVRPVFIYAVDISEFALNKLRDRGTLEVTTIVSNIQDFLFKLVTLLKEK